MARERLSRLVRPSSDPDPRFVKSGWAISGKMASASTARSGRKDSWREQQQKQFFWEHEKVQPTKTFILPCRAADPRGDFPLDDLQSGRTDLMCRAISSAMFFSSGVRRDVNVVLILGSASGSPGSASGTSAAGDAGGESGHRAGPVKTRAVWVNGRNVRHLRPDERNVAFVLQTAVWAYTGRVAALSRRVESSRRPGKVGTHTEDGCGEQEDNGIGVSAAAMTESVSQGVEEEGVSWQKRKSAACDESVHNSVFRSVQGVLTERSQRACQAEPTAAGPPHDDTLAGGERRALVGSPARVEQSRKGRLTIPQKVCILRERWHVCMHIYM